MAVSLRVVGIFYRRNDIPFESGMTVKSVLDAAVASPGGPTPADKFNYVSGQSRPTAIPDGKPSVTAFFARYATDPTSETSHAEYPEGEYFLPETLVGNPGYLVWQYYVFTADPQQGGTYIPRKPRIQSFADATVPDGGAVVWRLVSILSGPQRVPTVYRGAFGLDAAASPAARIA